jgi:nicotinamidase-related amidase
VAVVSGRVGFTAFANTGLEDILRERGIRDGVSAGVPSSLCIDATGRAAYERGCRATVLADCATGRTPNQHDSCCANVAPLSGRTALSRTAAGDLTRSAVP